MRYLSLFSGIEAATTAWQPLGWTPVAFSEIDPFACAVLAHHYPSVKNIGDVTKLTDADIAALGPIDLVVGGSPCQDLSIAGKRKGLNGSRSSLFYEQIRIFESARALCGARWLVWENVPGAFATNQGRDFACVVGEMAGLDLPVPRGGWQSAGACLGSKGLVEWRMLDAQYVRVESHPSAVPQRRNRVFAVLDTGDWQRRGPILIESEGLQGNPAPRRTTGKIAPTIPARSTAGGGLGTDFDLDGGLIPDAAHTLRAEGFDAGEDGTGRGTPLIPQISQTITARTGKGPCGDVDDQPLIIGFNARQDPDAWNGHVGPLDTDGQTQAVAFAENCRAEVRLEGGDGRVSSPLSAGGGKPGQGRPCIAQNMQVRRFTPTECERLQGFPDGYTRIPYRNRPADKCADGPRYKALGNSMAVNVMRWAGERIASVETYLLR